MTAFALKDISQHIEERLKNIPADDGLNRFRHDAFAEFKRQGLPSIKTEDWKYTSLRKLQTELFGAATPDNNVSPEVHRALETNRAKNLLVVVNGYFSPELSRLEVLPAGLRINTLRHSTDDQHACSAASPGQIANINEHPFAAINCAIHEEVQLIEVGENIRIDTPVEIAWVSSGNTPVLANPRLLIQVGRGARLTLVEYHLGGQTRHFINKVSEIVLADSARLTHIQIQDSRADRFINGAHVRCLRNSIYQSQNYDLGGDFIRNDLAVYLGEPGSEALLDGLFITSNGQHADNHIRIDHLAPHCRSRATYKGLLGASGHGVFNGKLIVHPDAVQTDAQQLNHNLLLSPHVDINTKPELEIYCDDVKCSHGCTTGELDPDQMFYLLSRGIDKPTAQGLLVDAFARDIVERLVERLQEYKTDQAEELTAKIGKSLNPALAELVNSVKGAKA